MNTKQIITFGLICAAIGFCLGFISFHKQTPLGGAPTVDSLGGSTWDDYK